MVLSSISLMRLWGAPMMRSVRARASLPCGQSVACSRPALATASLLLVGRSAASRSQADGVIERRVEVARHQELRARTRLPAAPKGLNHSRACMRDARAPPVPGVPANGLYIPSSPPALKNS